MASGSENTHPAFAARSAPGADRCLSREHSDAVCRRFLAIGLVHQLRLVGRLVANVPPGRSTAAWQALSCSQIVTKERAMDQTATTRPRHSGDGGWKLQDAKSRFSELEMPQVFASHLSSIPMTFGIKKFIAESISRSRALMVGFCVRQRTARKLTPLRPSGFHFGIDLVHQHRFDASHPTSAISLARTSANSVGLARPLRVAPRAPIKALDLVGQHHARRSACQVYLKGIYRGGAMSRLLSKCRGMRPWQALRPGGGGFGWGTWIRTKAFRVRVGSSTAKLSPILGGGPWSYHGGWWVATARLGRQAGACGFQLALHHLSG